MNKPANAARQDGIDMQQLELENIIEGILFVSGEPVGIARMAEGLGLAEDDVRTACSALRDKYVYEQRGIRLVFLDKDVQLCSAPEHADVIRSVLETRKKPQLSQQAMEVLAIVAYFQPVTKTYVEQIRGVDSSYTVNLLNNKGLIETCGRLSVPGRPMLYRTTPAFLRSFGIDTLDELPELAELNDEPPEGGEDDENAQERLQEVAGA